MRRFKAGILLILALLLFSMVSSCDGHNVYMPIGTWAVRGKVFDTFSQAMTYLLSVIGRESGTSRDLVTSDVTWDRTMYLLRDVDEDERGEAIYVPERFSGDLCVNFQGYEYWFDTSLNDFIEIRGGDRIDVINGTTVITEDTVSRTAALIVGVRTVTIDEHMIDDRRTDPAAITVTETGTLRMTSTTGAYATEDNPSIAGTLTIEDGGVLIMDSGSVNFTDIDATSNSDITITGGTAKIDAITEVDQDRFEISGGTIINPHDIAAIIDDAIPEEHDADVTREYIHAWEKISETVVAEPTCHTYGTVKVHYECSLCDAEYDETYQTPMLEHNKVWLNDRNHHWAECSLCGDILVEKEGHTFVTIGGTTYCTYCGYVPEQSSGVNSGFDVTVEDLIPAGYLTASELDTETNLYTVTLTSTNEESVPDHFSWYIDDELVAGETGTSITAEYRYESFNVMCVFWNEKGTGSASITLE